MYKSFIIIIICLFSCSVEDEICPDEFQFINDNCYYINDLAILNIFIQNSINTIKSSLDTNANDSIEPLELSSQWPGGMKWNEQGRLIKLWAKYDSLSGKIPESIGQLTYLETLNLAVNQLSGNIPQSIGKLNHLKWLYLWHNQLTGTIPEEICNIINNLTNVRIEYNQLCPPYPNCIIDKVGLQDTTNCYLFE